MRRPSLGVTHVRGGAAVSALVKSERRCLEGRISGGGAAPRGLRSCQRRARSEIFRAIPRRRVAQFAPAGWMGGEEKAMNLRHLGGRLMGHVKSNEDLASMIFKGKNFATKPEEHVGRTASEAVEAAHFWRTGT